MAYKAIFHKIRGFSSIPNDFVPAIILAGFSIIDIRYFRVSTVSCFCFMSHTFQVTCTAINCFIGIYQS